MDKLKALYNSYIEQGVLSSQTTFEQFSLADSSTQENLYQQGIDNKVLSSQTDINTFQSAWDEVKKKDESVSISQEDVTESVTPTGQEEVISSDVSETISPKEVDPIDESVQTDKSVERELTPTELDERLYQSIYGKAIEAGDASVPSLEDWKKTPQLYSQEKGDLLTIPKTLEKSYDDSFVGLIGRMMASSGVTPGPVSGPVYTGKDEPIIPTADKYTTEPMFNITDYKDEDTNEFVTSILSTVLDFFVMPNVGIGGALVKSASKVLPKLPILGAGKYTVDALISRGMNPEVAAKIVQQQLPKVVSQLDKAGSKFGFFEAAKNFQTQIQELGGIENVDFTQSPEAFSQGYGLGAGLGLIGQVARQIPKLGTALKTDGIKSVSQKGVTGVLGSRGLNDSRILGAVGESLGFGGEVGTFGYINATTPTLQNPKGELTAESFKDGMADALKYVIGFRTVGLASKIAQGKSVFNKQFTEFNEAEREQAWSLITDINSKIESGELSPKQARKYLDVVIDRANTPITLVEKVMQEISGLKSNLPRQEIFNKVFDIKAQAQPNGTYKINTFSKDGLLLTSSTVEGPLEVSRYVSKFSKERDNQIQKTNDGEGNYPVNNTVSFTINNDPTPKEPTTDLASIDEQITTEDVEELSPEVKTELDEIKADENIDLSELDAITPTEEVPESVQSNIEKIEEFYNGKIEELQEEITVEESNTKEGIAEIKAKIADVRKDKSLSKDDKLESIEELKAELEDFKQEQKDIISTYKDDIKVVKSEMKSDIKETKKSAPEFRRKPLTTLTESQNTETDAKEAQILETLNERADNFINVSEIKETEATPSEINVEALNERTGGNFKEIDVKTLDGVPVMWNISDQLTTGNYNPNVTDVNQNYSVTNPLTGNEITNLKGGLGFSSVKGHENIAWASVTQDKVNNQINSAKKIYENNKPKFDKLWAEGALPDGHVPMVVVKMGNDSMKSNEALIRVIQDNMASFPAKNKISALKALNEELSNVKDKYKKVVDTGLTMRGKKASGLTIKNYSNFIAEIQDVQDMIKQSKAKSIEDILSTENLQSLKGITSVAQITNLITTGNFDVLKKQPGKSRKPVLKALYGDSPSQQDINKFNIKKIADVITEPELANVPQRSAFMVTSIDVKNPQTIRTSHPNYPVGPKGKVLGILKQPISIVDLVPSAYNNVALGIAEEISGERGSRSDAARLVQTIPVQAGLVNKEFLGTPIGINPDSRFIDFLQRSFPETNMVVDADTFNSVMERDGVKKYLKEGDVIYGVTANGEIFINPEVHNTSSALYNTAIHEMGHVWTKYIKQSPKGKKLYNRGAELVKETDTYKEQLEIFNGDEVKAVEEAMVILIGNKGESITNQATKSKWIDWLMGLWDYIKSQFKQFKDLTNKEIQDLTLDQFLGTALRDILGGKPIKLTPKERAAMKADVAFKKASKSDKQVVEKVVTNLRNAGYSEVGIREILKEKGVNSKLINEIITEAPKVEKVKKEFDADVFIKEARDANFTDERIADYLTQKKGMKAKDVKEMFSVGLGDLPESFANIKGGSKAGLKLFKRVNKFRDGLVSKNKSTKKDKLSEAQITDKTIEFLEKQPEYKAEAETYTLKGDTKRRIGLSTIQAEMITEFQKMNPLRQTQAMRTKVETAKRDIRERARGARNLKETQNILKSFIRKTIPSAQYTKSEVINLINKITRADRASIDNLINEVFEFATSKNVNILDNKITSILNLKTQEVYSGRIKAVKVDSETAKLIQFIIKNRLTEDATAEQIELSEQVQRNEIEKLSENAEENISEIMAKTSLININNSLLMENIDPSKVDALDIALENLEALVEKGKSELARIIEAQKAEDDRQFELAYSEITGEQIDMSKDSKDELLRKSKRKLASEQNKKAVQSKVKAFAYNILKFGRDYTFYSAEALQGLMDAISKMPGELFGGKLQELVTDKVDTSSRVFKERRLMYNDVLTKKFEEIYGKGWKKIVRSNAMLSTPIESLDITYSQNKLYYLYNQFKDPANRPTFKRMWGEDFMDVAKEIESKLDPKVKEFADWQVNEYFPSLYDYYNEVYKKIYRTDMPWNQFYAGRIYREGITPEALDLLGENSVVQTSVGGSSTKARVNNTNEIIAMDGTDALMTYLNDMEFFAAYAENIRDINKIFTNPIIKNTIEANHGERLYSFIKDRITQIANQGTKNEDATKFINTMNNVFITTRVALSPVIFLKQMTSTLTYGF